jgi:uncharacterized damage-inducible protein DinB
MGSDAKADLHRYLQVARDALLWKLDGLSEYDARRPLVPTGTNLLGLVKHMAGVEAGYFGVVFDRPFPEPTAGWGDGDDEPNTDMWAKPNESREQIVDLYRRVWVHADATIEVLELDAPGRVPWWGEHGEVTLHRVLAHVATEAHRHAGHADIVRELIDGAVGFRQGNDNLPHEDEAWWAAYRDRVEAAARAAPEGSSPPA